MAKRVTAAPIAVGMTPALLYIFFQIIDYNNRKNNKLRMLK
jgi:hypothetical protein